MKRLFMVLAVWTVMATGGYAQELPDGDGFITAVTVSGLTRTRPHIVENPLRKFVGMSAAGIDTNEVLAAVKSIRVVEPLSVAIANDQAGGKILMVAVREKWTVFPLPVVSIGSGGWSAGGILADLNAFGAKDIIMVMGMYDTGNLMAGAMYANTPDGIGEWGWHIAGRVSIQQHEDTDQTGGQTLRRYHSLSVNPTAGLTYALGEHITPSLNLSYREVALQDTEDPVRAPKNGMRGITLSPNINISYNSWDGYFLNETQAALKYHYAFVVDGDDVHSVSVNAVLHHSIVPGFRVTAKSSVFFATLSASPFFEISPMNGVADILAGSYSVTRFAGVSLGLEKYLFVFSLGMVTVSAAYQAAYSHGEVLVRQFDHGAAAVLQIYFSGLALPAVGLGAAYNVAKNVWQYTFNMGMSF
jgi:hypothetical protein